MFIVSHVAIPLDACIQQIESAVKDTRQIRSKIETNLFLNISILSFFLIKP
jgi:hypothetical protein